MQRFAIFTVGAMFLAAAAAGDAWGQIVRVGPGGVRVRAPFVGVNVDPYGGTSVRAPFTNIYAPGYAYPNGAQYGNGRWYADSGWSRWGTEYDLRQTRGIETRQLRETPSLPADVELAEMNWQELRRVLRFGALELEQTLDRMDGGGGWKKYLQVGTLRDMVADDANRPPDHGTAAKLVEIYQAYDSASANPQYSAVAALWGFRAVHGALGEFLSPPWERQRRQLAASAIDLQNTLARMSNGGGWQRYLELPGDVIGSDSTSAIPPPPSHGAEPNVEQLEKILARYDSVRQNPEYRVIAELSSFLATRENLAAYVALLREVPATGTEPPQPAAETLPAPPTPAQPPLQSR
jgi:hypothetical protein